MAIKTIRRRYECAECERTYFITHIRLIGSEGNLCMYCFKRLKNRLGEEHLHKIMNKSVQNVPWRIDLDYVNDLPTKMKNVALRRYHDYIERNRS